MGIKEIEAEIRMLSSKELTLLTTWLVDYHEQVWDQEIADDLECGKFDKLLDEIDKEYAAGLAEKL